VGAEGRRGGGAAGAGQGGAPLGLQRLWLDGNRIGAAGAAALGAAVAQSLHTCQALLLHSAALGACCGGGSAGDSGALGVGGSDGGTTGGLSRGGLSELRLSGNAVGR
jgi:hypothetical protein